MLIAELNQNTIERKNNKLALYVSTIYIYPALIALIQANEYRIENHRTI